MTAPQGHVERRRAEEAVAYVDLGAALHEQPHDLEPALIGGEVEGGLAVARPRVEGNTLVQQGPHACDVAAAGRVAKASPWSPDPEPDEGTVPTLQVPVEELEDGSVALDLVGALA